MIYITATGYHTLTVLNEFAMNVKCTAQHKASNGFGFGLANHMIKADK